MDAAGRIIIAETEVSQYIFCVTLRYVNFSFLLFQTSTPEYLFKELSAPAGDKCAFADEVALERIRDGPEATEGKTRIDQMDNRVGTHHDHKAGDIQHQQDEEVPTVPHFVAFVSRSESDDLFFFFFEKVPKSTWSNE